MFSIFKKNTSNILSPVNGQLIPLSDVSDPVFSQGMIGPGFAVKPTSDVLYSPVRGIITSVFPTKHAIALETVEGKEILIHIGIDTVELNGEGFDILVSEANKVTPETKLAIVDRAYLEERGKESTIMVLFPNNSDIYSIEAKTVKAGDVII